VIGDGQVSMKPYLCISIVLLVKDLEHNLLSISQLCDNGNSVIFDKDRCTVYQSDETKMFVASTCNNIYKIDMDELSSQNVSCLMFE